MPQVKGIDAVMIYAEQPAILAAWYAECLGIATALNPVDQCYYGEVRDDEVGKVIHFGIYPAKGDFLPRGRSVMVNYRVDDLDRFLMGLKQRGTQIERILEEEQGRFAYFADPEGNPIEVWQRRAS
jgi:predicted enzyme related to lactoylglutathione lyase